MSPEVVEALRAEAALNERQRMEAALGDFQAQLESERDREAALNVQKYYASQLREKRAATTQSNPRDEVPVTPQVPAQAAQTTADGHFAAQLQTTLQNLQQAKVKNDAASRSRSATQV
ncbi:hypothetical protein PF003_g37467 [Phytophthora fragariae]|nr:hypothetical protein PF003_g37467 [Phytophthora fragariae]